MASSKTPRPRWHALIGVARSPFYSWVFLASAQEIPAAAATTLARLSFWMPPERMAEFGQVYESALAPLLKERGFC